MQKRNTFKMLMTIWLTIAFLLVFTEATNADTGKPEKFTFYLTGDLSGPMGPSNTAMIPALSDFCEWYNHTKGGIRGVPLTFMARDNAGDVTKGVAAYEYFRLQKPKPVVGSFHPAFVGEALRDRLAEDKIVNWFNTASNPILFPVGYLVGFCPSYPSGVAATTLWVKEKWAKVKIKVGLLTWDNSYGKGIFDPELRKWFAQQEGMELVAEEVFNPKDVDVSTQILRLKNKGVNFIVDNTLGNGPVLINKSLKSMGLLNQDINDTTPGKIHHATNVWGMDDSVVRLGGDLMEGLFGLRFWASYAEENNRGVQLANEWLAKKKRGPNIKVGSYVLKWNKLSAVTHILEKIVDEKGWSGVTGEVFLQKLLNLKKFDSIGIGDITYSPNYPMIQRAKIYMVKNGKILPASDYMDLPDLRPPQYR